MGNIQYLTGLIALLQLGCILAAVTWYGDDGETIVAREGQDTNIKIVCHYRVDAGEEFSWLPHLIKIQDMGYVEEEEDERREVDSDRGLEVVIGQSVKLDEEYANIYEALMELSGNSDLPEGDVKLTVTIANPTPRDSGKYMCEASNGGQTFQKIHTLIVLPSNEADVLTVTLSGMADNEDNDTRFNSDTSDNMAPMIYYGNENRDSPYGMIECRACDGASVPIITMKIGDEYITDNIPLVEEPITTFDGDFEGMQTIHRCAARMHPRYQLTADHNGKEITCMATVNNKDGNAFVTKEVTKSLMVYHPAARGTEGCEREQFAPRYKEGKIRCRFSAVPTPQMVTFEKEGTGIDAKVYDSDIQSGDGWTMTLDMDGTDIVAVLTLLEVDDEDYGIYRLVVENRAGSSEIEIDFQYGQSNTGENNTGAASGLQCTLSLISASLLLALLKL